MAANTIAGSARSMGIDIIDWYLIYHYHNDIKYLWKNL
jgi:hypothetical protein